jgi:hypothetical protein
VDLGGQRLHELHVHLRDRLGGEHGRLDSDPLLEALFAEFDKIAPSRDHASDGSIGDTAHQQEVSDHNPDETGSVPIHDADHLNEVHAIDVDN